MTSGLERTFIISSERMIMLETNYNGLCLNLVNMHLFVIFRIFEKNIVKMSAKLLQCYSKKGYHHNCGYNFVSS